MQIAVQSHGRPASGRPSIKNLYSEFEAAHAVFFKANQELDSAEAGSFDSSWHKKFERTTSRCNKLANQIATTPATSMDEIMLKLRVVAWLESDISYKTLEALDHWRARWKPTPDVEQALHILAQLQEDLRKVVTKGPAEKSTSRRPHRDQTGAGLRP